LSQVRVAKVGQEIDVWVLGRTRVRLLVVSLAPSTKGNAALLTTDSEVSIAPKMHARRKAAGGAPSSTSQDGAAKKDPAKSSLPATVLRVLPTRLIERFSPSSARYNRPEILAYIHPWTFSNLAQSRYPMKEDMKDVFLMFSYRLLEPPQNPLEPPRNANANAETPEPVAQVLHPGGKSEHAAVDQTSSNVPTETFLLVGWSDQVLESHVYFPYGLEGVGDWHWIHVTPTGERKTISDLFSDIPAQNLDEAEALQPFLPDIVLSGVQDILEEGTKQLVASFALHSLDKMVHGSV